MVLPSPRPRPGTAETSRRAVTRRTLLGGIAAGAAVASVGLAWRPSPAAASGTPLSFDFVNDPPFSFSYGGVSSGSLLPGWSPSSSTVALDAVRTQQTVTWTGTSGLVVRCVAVTYADFPVVEWTVHFENTGSGNTPTLSQVLAIDTLLQGAATSSWTIHTNNGSTAVATDFAPAELTLSSTPGQYKLFSTGGGRPTSGHLSGDPLAPGGAWPYYNFDWGGAGAIVAIGWPGQWGLQTGLDTAGRAPVIGGMTNYDGPFGSTPTLYDLQLTEMYLEPGEAIRTPLIVTMAWQGGDWIDAQNVWRQWFLTHNTPHPNGTNPPPLVAAAAAESSITAVQADASDYIGVMAAYRAQGLTPDNGGPLDWLWIDTGWFPIPIGVPPDNNAWTYTGTWQADPARFPNGMLEVTDEVRSYGARTIVWHEPERCRPGTWLYDNHPEWMLADGDPQHRYLNWGHPLAYNWAVDTFTGLIDDGGVDLFRIDFNYVGPLANWNATDVAGRRGATQAHWVAGFLSFLDHLRTTYPAMLIDNCASGGRRLDLETLRRSVPLTRSDLFRVSEGNQCHTFGLSSWIVCQGGTADAYSTYGIRSAMGWHMEAHLVDLLTAAPTAAEWATYADGLHEWNAVKNCYFGDFYPLTAYSTSASAWIAYQFDRPDTGAGIVQAFARPSAPSTSLTVQLRGLVPTATYHIWDVDHPTAVSSFMGAQLATTGVDMAPVPRPYAVTLAYQKQ
jgi:alpha-galactosidase